jgi:Zn-dependent protease
MPRHAPGGQYRQPVIYDLGRRRSAVRPSPLFLAVLAVTAVGGAVYLHPHTFRTRAQRSWAAAAGPLTNVAFAVGLVLLADSQLPGSPIDAINSFFTAAEYTGHARFWSAVAFLALLQVTAAVLNLLPVPGLDGYAIIEPYLDPQTQQAMNKVKPWGLLGVIVLLFYLKPLNDAFFRLVYAIYRGFGGDSDWAQIGREFFRWWAKMPW